MTSLTITKTGRIALETPVSVRSISLKSTTLYMNLYNLNEETRYRATGSSEDVVIPPGYYTYEQLQEFMPNGFEFDENTLKVKVRGRLEGGLTKLISDGYLYLTPLCLYVYVDEIDTSQNLFDGKRSSLLTVIPIGNTNVGEIFQYNPLNHFKKMHTGELNSLGIKIENEHGQPYIGKFVAELTLQ